MSVKLMGWRRVLPIFYALLSVLLVLWFFWQIGPQFASNLKKLIGSISASPTLEAWIEDVKKNYQFYVFLFSMFVISMGLTRWLGKRLWYQAQISRRKELKLPVASLFSSDTTSFSYLSLFQGGLIGLVLVSWHSLFLLASPSHEEDVLKWLPLAMVAPIGALAGYSIPLLLMPIFSRKYFGTVASSPILIISSTFIIGIVGSFFFVGPLFLDQENGALPVLIIMAVIVCLSWSYAYGVGEGLKAADPESTYPLVTVEVIQGTGFDEAWLYERTDSDYRIVTKSGSNHIIPASNVKQIEGLAEIVQ
jgi:hypothetical protein